MVYILNNDDNIMGYGVTKYLFRDIICIVQVYFATKNIELRRIFNTFIESQKINF